MLDEMLPIFDPFHPYKLFWDTVYLMNLIVLFFIIPLKVALKVQWEEIFTYSLPFFCLIVLIIDTGISMNCGFFKSGEIIKER
jgi:hypothetical protein